MRDAAITMTSTATISNDHDHIHRHRKRLILSLRRRKSFDLAITGTTSPPNPLKRWDEKAKLSRRSSSDHFPFHQDLPRSSVRCITSVK